MFYEFCNTFPSILNINTPLRKKLLGANYSEDVTTILNSKQTC